MDAIFMNSENSKRSDSHRHLLNLSDKINLKRSNKYVALSNLKQLLYMEKYKKSYKNNKFEISAPTWNEEFELPDWSYSVSDVQPYFECIIKRHETVTDNPSIRRIYVNKNKSRILSWTFKTWNNAITWKH